MNIAAIGRLRAQTNAAIVVKGVLNAQGATAAIARGAQGLIVSSYGLGEAVHPLEALPAIAQAVHGRVPILVDSGFRRGTDVAKALALGATAVLIARPAIWGLAAYGADGVQYVLEMLHDFSLVRTNGSFPLSQS